MSGRTLLAPGPFRAENIVEGSRYELSNGHPVYCQPTGRRGGASNLVGGQVLETDPSVKVAGVDVGFSKDPGYLRAPDVSVGGFALEPGWAPGSPPLAVEYADTGQDEAELRKKIAELLDGGTRHVWVVRLVGPRRVEVHDHGQPMRLARPGDNLIAPGILQNPVPVLALFDRDAAHEATLRNLLQRKGYESLDAVRAEGKTAGVLEGKTEGVLEGKLGALFAVLRARSLAVSDAERERIVATADPRVIDGWITRAATAGETAQVLGPPEPPPQHQTN